jgi:hypothetical protein
MADDRHEREPTQTVPAKDGDLEVPIPSREDFLNVVDRVAGRGIRKPPDETSGPLEQSESD